MFLMVQMRLSKTWRFALLASAATGTIVAPTAAGTASAAPETSTPVTTPDVRVLHASHQTPVVGVNRSGPLPTGAFAAPIAAAATGPDTTVIWLEPMPANACTTTLRDTRVGLTWVNDSTGRTDDATFDACSAGKPHLSPPLTTGSGTIRVTATVLGQDTRTFTLSPGTATITR